MAYTPLGCHYTWWRGDPLPALPLLEGFRVDPVEDAVLIAGLDNRDYRVIRKRINENNKPYIAFLDEVPVAFGWSATRSGRIEEVRAEWPISPIDRYLFDFVTLPDWRGRGVYPHLLQAIMFTESVEAERFWIGHVIDNDASRRGILKAGFQPDLLIVRTEDGRVRWIPKGSMERTLADPIVQIFKKGDMLLEEGQEAYDDSVA